MNKLSSRNISLDILRILSMIFVVSLHYLGNGGGYYNIINGDVSLITLNYTISSLLESLSIVGVNCFVAIFTFAIMFCINQWIFSC